MRVAVTGGCGFIGSHLVDRLAADGHDVVILDNLSTGQRLFVQNALATGRVTLHEVDVKTLELLVPLLQGCDEVYHLAANADVRHGPEQPRRDLDENTIGTFNVLEASRQAGVKAIAFASTGSVYGEAAVIPTPEDAPFPVQTSLYGASKLAGEALASAYAEAFGITVRIFRFVSILGERYSHGHVIDFYRQLRSDPLQLHVLGDGTQRKSYLYVRDCIEAIMVGMRTPGPKVAIYNLGQDHYCDVRSSITWITTHLRLNPTLIFSGSDRGWIGDNPFIFLDCSRIRALGWTPTLSIPEAVSCTVDYLLANQWLLDTRRA